MSEYRKVSTSSHTFVDAEEQNVVGLPMQVADFMNIVVAVTGADVTVKFQGAIQDTTDGDLGIPDFDSPATATNQWDYIQAINYEDNAPLNGDEGLILTTAATQILEFNTNGLSWVNIEISGNTGVVTARGKGYSTN